MNKEDYKLSDPRDLTYFGSDIKLVEGEIYEASDIGVEYCRCSSDPRNLIDSKYYYIVVQDLAKIKISDVAKDSRYVAFDSKVIKVIESLSVEEMKIIKNIEAEFSKRENDRTPISKNKFFNEIDNFISNVFKDKLYKDQKDINIFIFALVNQNIMPKEFNLTEDQYTLNICSNHIELSDRKYSMTCYDSDKNIVLVSIKLYGTGSNGKEQEYSNRMIVDIDMN